MPSHENARALQGTHRARRERLTRGALLFSALLTAGAVLAIFGFLAWLSLPLFGAEGLAKVLSWRWRPFEGEFGILPMLCGSLFLSVSAMALAMPLGIGLCCFVRGAGPGRAAAPVLALVKFMTSVPTVIYGFAAVFLLVPLVRSALGGSGFSWLAAALVLGLLVLPTVVLVLDAQLALVEPRTRLAAAALGFGRAVGDTLLPLMLAGNAPQVPGSLLDPLRTLTAHIALVVATDVHSTAYLSLFAGGLILFAVTVAEPDVRVLALQVDMVSGGQIPGSLLVLTVALGVGIFVALALLRIVLNVPITYLLAGGYGVVIVLSLFTPATFVPVAFDAGGVTTGPMTVPFILAIGLGTASVLRGRSNLADGFGLVGLASIGPIIGMMVLGLVFG